jgi:hypothetical protein
MIKEEDGNYIKQILIILQLMNYMYYFNEKIPRNITKFIVQ